MQSSINNSIKQKIYNFVCLSILENDQYMLPIDAPFSSETVYTFFSFYIFCPIDDVEKKITKIKKEKRN